MNAGRPSRMLPPCSPHALYRTDTSRGIRRETISLYRTVTHFGPGRIGSGSTCDAVRQVSGWRYAGWHPTPDPAPSACLALSRSLRRALLHPRERSDFFGTRGGGRQVLRQLAGGPALCVRHLKASSLARLMRVTARRTPPRWPAESENGPFARPRPLSLCVTFLDSRYFPC